MNTGNKIKMARKSKGFTQSELADKVGISRSYLGAIEINKHEPSTELLLKISTILETSPTELLSNEEKIKSIEIEKKRELLNNLISLTNDNRITWNNTNIEINEEVSIFLREELYSYEIISVSKYNDVNYILLCGKTMNVIYDISKQLEDYRELLIDDDVDRIMREEPQILMLYIYVSNDIDKSILISDLELQGELEIIKSLKTSHNKNINLIDEIIKTQL